jgi:hypothetical protein
MQYNGYDTLPNIKETLFSEEPKRLAPANTIKGKIKQIENRSNAALRTLLSIFCMEKIAIKTMPLVSQLIEKPGLLT